jgi:hypothetical protein
MEPKQAQSTKKLFSKEFSGTNSIMNPDRPYVHSTHSDIRQSPAFKKLFETTRKHFAPHLVQQET